MTTDTFAALGTAIDGSGLQHDLGADPTTMRTIEWRNRHDTA